MNKSSNVSIVIPVYNEAAHLPACLDAISRQTVRPYEVIVVDNNSSDDTVDIARSYPFVKVITESRQGVIFARDAGFDTARGAVIGRIDADTVLQEDWIETVQRIMQDRTIAAVTGRARYHDMALSGLLDRIDLTIRSHLARRLGDEIAMQGANMALRRAVWQKVRGAVCREGGMHEDLDLSVHINWLGYKIIFDRSMVASLGYRQAESSFRKFTTYIMLSPRTYASHGLTSQRHMYPVCLLAVVCYVPINLLHRGYDKQNERFSWSRLFEASESRVNPATYVDY